MLFVLCLPRSTLPLLLTLMIELYLTKRGCAALVSSILTFILNRARARILFLESFFVRAASTNISSANANVRAPNTKTRCLTDKTTTRDSMTHFPLMPFRSSLSAPGASHQKIRILLVQDEVSEEQDAPSVAPLRFVTYGQILAAHIQSKQRPFSSISRNTLCQDLLLVVVNSPFKPFIVSGIGRSTPCRPCPKFLVLSPRER
jgi:hypothetical protein